MQPKVVLAKRPEHREQIQQASLSTARHKPSILTLKLSSQGFRYDSIIKAHELEVRGVWAEAYLLCGFASNVFGAKKRRINISGVGNGTGTRLARAGRAWAKQLINTT